MSIKDGFPDIQIHLGGSDDIIDIVAIVLALIIGASLLREILDRRNHPS